MSTDGLVYYTFDNFSGVKHGVFTRLGGVSAAPFASLNVGGSVGDDPVAVRANHLRMYSALGVEDSKACTVWQVHSADVVVVNAPPADGQRWLAQADALITDQPRIPLSMRFADCVPLLFHDPVKGVIGAAHAGWRGTVQGMAAVTVRALTRNYGCKPADIRVAIGPSIGRDSYQVGAEVVEAVKAYFGETDGLIARDPVDMTPYFDLWAANRLDLERAGVEHIEIAGICTAKRTDEFFSHRAEGGKTGRFGMVICL